MQDFTLLRITCFTGDKASFNGFVPIMEECSTILTAIIPTTRAVKLLRFDVTTINYDLDVWRGLFFRRGANEAQRNENPAQS
jgi:hypothetical protein